MKISRVENIIVLRLFSLCEITKLIDFFNNDKCFNIICD